MVDGDDDEGRKEEHEMDGEQKDCGDDKAEDDDGDRGEVER